MDSIVPIFSTTFEGHVSERIYEERSYKVRLAMGQVSAHSEILHFMLISQAYKYF